MRAAVSFLIPYALWTFACSSPPVDTFTGGSGAGAGPILTGAGAGSGSGIGGGSGGEGGSGSGSGAGSGSGGGMIVVDQDGDGLDDTYEASLAESYLPFLSLDPDDGCPRGGIVYRVRPHPDDATRIHIVYDHLYERDCGLTAHAGDNEAFGVTIDPSIPPPAGILAMRAVGHQATLCEKTTECGACWDLPACATAMKDGALFPVVFSSKDKHAGYVEKDTCNPFLACLDTCTLAPTSAKPPMVNAGEPDAPLVSNLTTQGFIHAANGWTEQELFDVNPWEPEKDFGGAGNVAGDLVDPAFVPPACP
ncbi:hypothetical protein [Polyangium sorediatum]|uniref:Lipoprotein n=1 Tax=Polyangium sorediatum TaxID=889274 RepID=A0ABT6NUW3_9BACT|nr:hypothetical protein [Polyangium sorediatum]MDI1432076.1 hypothetical protein [Polyangium sorediatum]